MSPSISKLPSSPLPPPSSIDSAHRPEIRDSHAPASYGGIPQPLDKQNTQSVPTLPPPPAENEFGQFLNKQCVEETLNKQLAPGISKRLQDPTTFKQGVRHAYNECLAVLGQNGQRPQELIDAAQVLGRNATLWLEAHLARNSVHMG